jgi:hypothetical protein
MMYGVPNMKTDKIDVVQRRVDLMAAEVGGAKPDAGWVGGWAAGRAAAHLTRVARGCQGAPLVWC